jgi:hypothetical protein
LCAVFFCPQHIAKGETRRAQNASFHEAAAIWMLKIAAKFKARATQGGHKRPRKVRKFAGEIELAG